MSYMVKNSIPFVLNPGYVVAKASKWTGRICILNKPSIYNSHICFFINAHNTSLGTEKGKSDRNRFPVVYILLTQSP